MAFMFKSAGPKTSNTRRPAIRTRLVAAFVLLEAAIGVKCASGTNSECVSHEHMYDDLPANTTYREADSGDLRFPKQLSFREVGLPMNFLFSFHTDKRKLEIKTDPDTTGSSYVSIDEKEGVVFFGPKHGELAEPFGIAVTFRVDDSSTSQTAVIKTISCSGIKPTNAAYSFRQDVEDLGWADNLRAGGCGWE